MTVVLEGMPADHMLIGLLPQMILETTMAVALYILLTIGHVGMFRKLGEPGWKAFVPFYRAGVYARYVGLTGPFWVVVVICALTLLVLLGSFSTVVWLVLSNQDWLYQLTRGISDVCAGLMPLLMLLVGPAWFAFRVVLAINTAWRFEKPGWLAIVLFLFWPVALPLLAFDPHAAYVPDERVGELPRWWAASHASIVFGAALVAALLATFAMAPDVFVQTFREAGSARV